jgi:hypothetical protein
MITIDLGMIEYYDGKSNEFVYDEGGIVRFEYSLKVLYDWESKWRKPFLKGGLTDDEQIDFFMMMALDPIKKEFLTRDVMKTLSDYITDTNTATTFTTLPEDEGGKATVNKSKLYTAEEIYALMFSSGIPLEFENRNLNRLLTILRIISTHNTPPKKMSKQDVLKQNASLNAQRKAMLKSKG